MTLVRQNTPILFWGRLQQPYVQVVTDEKREAKISVNIFLPKWIGTEMRAVDRGHVQCKKRWVLGHRFIF